MNAGQRAERERRRRQREERASGVRPPLDASRPAAPHAAALVVRLQRLLGNAGVRRLVSVDMPGGAVQRVPRAGRPAPVPGLPRGAVNAAHRNLTADPQAAIEAVLRALASNGRIDRSTLEGATMLYVGDRERMPPGHYGHTSLTPGTETPRPCRVVLGTDAMQSVGVLLATVMHEYQHVLQFRAGHTADEAAGEVEARLWEVENLEQTGLWRDVRYMAELPGQLRVWWERLTPGQRERLQERMDAARATLTRMNERRLEEQRRMQTGR